MLVKIDDPVPGVEGVAFNGMHRVHVSPTGGVAFASRLKGTGVDSDNDWGLFRKKSTGVLELMVREGAAHPEDPRLLAGGECLLISHSTKPALDLTELEPPPLLH